MPAMSDHVSIIFRELLDEMKSMKRQQWTITNYFLLIGAAIFYLRDKADVYHFHTWLRAIAVIAAVLAVSMLLRIQWNMAGVRFRIDKLHKSYFDPQELVDVGLSSQEIDTLAKQSCQHCFELLRKGSLTKESSRHCFRLFSQGWEFLLALGLVVVIAAILIVLAL
jgi:hypothetical protein